jgi:DNA-binding transcriptional regulator YhcF (GntR family)
MSGTKLTPSAATLLAVLREMKPEDLHTVPNVVLADAIGVAAHGHRSRTVNRALVELEAAGFIAVTYRKQTKADPVGRGITVVPRPASDATEVE